MDVECHPLARIRDDLERMHHRPTYRHLHLDAAPGKLVRALTADLHSRGGRDRQLDFPAEALEPLGELVLPRGDETLEDIPSGSPVAVRLVRSISVRYRLSRPTRHGVSLVALPDNSSRSPVAKGLSVPA